MLVSTFWERSGKRRGGEQMKEKEGWAMERGDIKDGDEYACSWNDYREKHCLRVSTAILSVSGMDTGTPDNELDASRMTVAYASGGALSDRGCLQDVVHVPLQGSTGQRSPLG
jgi:hypothetical protein